MALQAVRFTEGRNTSCLETLAAVYAVLGNFNEAVKVIRQVLDKLNASGQGAEPEQFQRLLVR